MLKLQPVKDFYALPEAIRNWLTSDEVVDQIVKLNSHYRARGPKLRVIPDAISSVVLTLIRPEQINQYIHDRTALPPSEIEKIVYIIKHKILAPLEDGLKNIQGVDIGKIPEVEQSPSSLAPLITSPSKPAPISVNPPQVPTAAATFQRPGGSLGAISSGGATAQLGDDDQQIEEGQAPTQQQTQQPQQPRQATAGMPQQASGGGGGNFSDGEKIQDVRRSTSTPSGGTPSTVNSAPGQSIPYGKMPAMSQPSAPQKPMSAFDRLFSRRKKEGDLERGGKKAKEVDDLADAKELRKRIEGGKAPVQSETPKPFMLHEEKPNISEQASVSSRDFSFELPDKPAAQPAPKPPAQQPAQFGNYFQGLTKQEADKPPVVSKTEPEKTRVVHYSAYRTLLGDDTPDKEK